MRGRIVILMGVLLVGVHGAGGAEVAATTSATETLTAAQLLDRFEATQRRTYGSFISRLVSDNAEYLNEHPILQPGHRRSRTTVEIHADGQRFFWCEERSGQCFPRLAEKTPATDPRIKWFLYDDEHCYTSGHEPFRAINRAVQKRKPCQRSKVYRDCLAVTISDRFDTDAVFARNFDLGGDASPDLVLANLGSGGLVHVPSLVQKLRNAKTLVLEPKLEPVNGVPCYVLQAALAQTWKDAKGVGLPTDYVYRIHFDPAHDYHIAKLEWTSTQRLPAEKPGIQGPCTEDKLNMTNVQFQQIDGCWVPMAWQQDRFIRQLHNPRLYQWSKSTVRRTRVLLNPDHEALGSFRPRFIQNGWKIKLRGFDGRFDQAGLLVWRDGCVVNKAGQTLALR